MLKVKEETYIEQRKYNKGEGNSKTENATWNEKRGKFYRQNLIFKNDAKKFYREIGKEKVIVNETTAINDIETFWDTIWSEEKDFNERAEWIKNVQTGNANIQEQQWSDVKVEELQTTLRQCHKWK